ncbi:hypothetical protein LEYRA_33 [Paenibacillus phage Leyra]|uniref:Uncharacterized protein n=1 Tax=Paenibacillus phage Leyra TaxID=2070192 RepID=A0A2I7SDD2_9CAUD|nr:hypothetical protein HWB47_gp34 [Paenibacillus phage Leyra]AUS03897.1 hypothetical protein LEYRA_33 [Paenibacillus phage Leyra]
MGETYGYKGFTSTGAILVLFILLVIVSRTFFLLNKCGRNRITCLCGRLFLCKIKSPEGLT